MKAVQRTVQVGIVALARRRKIDRTHLQKVLAGKRNVGRRLLAVLKKEGIPPPGVTIITERGTAEVKKGTAI